MSALNASFCGDGAAPGAVAALPKAGTDNFCTLSRISMMIRSAVLRPMPGIRVSITASSASMMRRKSVTLAPDKTPKAILGPTPETLSRPRNSRRSPSVPKPNRICASSRTTRCVKSETLSPVDGRP